MLKTFISGAVGYPLLEMLYRGKTHYSMALAGGTSLCLLQIISRLPIRFSSRILLGGAGITAVEYGCGLIWNRSYKVWDYRKLPLNIHGQICLPYSLVWCGLSAAAIIIMRKKQADGEP